MSLLSTLQRYIPMLGSREPKRSRAESLALCPIRNPVVTWTTKPNPDPEGETETELIVLAVPRRDDAVARIITRLFQIQGQRKTELDEFGSELWLLCDGKHRVAQLVEHTAARYRLNYRQAEISVFAWMRTLAQRRLIGFITEEKRASHVSLNSRAKSGKRQRRPGSARRRH